MKKKGFICLILTLCFCISMICLPVQGEEPTAVATEVSTELPTAVSTEMPSEIPSSEPSATAEGEESSGGGNRWVFFLITSALSLAVAIPLAIRSGNKKYGK